MYTFTAFTVCGFGLTVYGTAFGLHAMTNAFYLFPAQPYIAIALLFAGVLMPIAGYLATTERA